MYILLAGVCVNIVTNYIFIHKWGVVGSAFASGIGWVFIWILSFQQTKKYAASFRWPIFFQNLVGIILLSLALRHLHLEGFLSGRIQLFSGIVGILFLYTLVFVSLNWTEFRRFQRIFRSKHII